MNGEKDGKVIGIVSISDVRECLNAELVRAGYGWVYDSHCRMDICHCWKKLEKRARQYGKGLWRGTDPVPP